MCYVRRLGRKNFERFKALCAHSLHRKKDKEQNIFEVFWPNACQYIVKRSKILKIQLSVKFVVKYIFGVF